MQFQNQIVGQPYNPPLHSANEKTSPLAHSTLSSVAHFHFLSTPPHLKTTTTFSPALLSSTRERESELHPCVQEERKETADWIFLCSVRKLKGRKERDYVSFIPCCTLNQLQNILRTQHHHSSNHCDQEHCLQFLREPRERKRIDSLCVARTELPAEVNSRLRLANYG